MTKQNVLNVLYIGLGIALFMFVLYRAIVLSITYDEVWLFYLASLPCSEIMYDPNCFQSANNHVLNTLLVKLVLLIDDKTIWLIRLPNVLAFVLYYISGIALFKQISSNKIFQLSGVLLASCMPFVLDFFSLSRGYGLALSFQLCSMACLLVYLNRFQYKYLIIGFVTAALAVYSNFTWLNFFIATWGVFNLSVYFFTSKEKTIFSFLKLNLPALCCTIILTLLSFKPITYLRQQDEFKWGSNAWIDSFHHFAKDLNYSNSFGFAVLTQVFVFALFVLTGYLMFKHFHKNASTQFSKLLFVFILLCTLITITIAQRFLLNVMYIDGRKALMYFIFIPLLFLFCLELLVKSNTHFKNSIAVLFTILFVGYNAFKINPKASKEWWFDEYNSEVLDYISKHQIPNHNGITISWAFGSSFNFYNKMVYNHKLNPIEIIDDKLINDKSAYYYIMHEDKSKVPQNYILVEQFGELGYLYQNTH